MLICYEKFYFLPSVPSMVLLLTTELLAKVRNLPFDCSTGSQLMVNGLRLDLFSFPVRGEPFDSPFALRFSKGERFAQDKLVEPQKILLQEAPQRTQIINPRVKNKLNPIFFLCSRVINS